MEAVDEITASTSLFTTIIAKHLLVDVVNYDVEQRVIGTFFKFHKFGTFSLRW